MKKVIAVMIMALALLAGCGDSGGGKPPVTEPPVMQNTVGFSCLDVGHGPCAGEIVNSSIWNSAPVTIKGNPAPTSYLNIEVTNDLVGNAVVFVYSSLSINGCWDEPVAFGVVNIPSGDTVIFQHVANNYRCGELGYQETDVMLYNASGFDPSAYPNPMAYPRTELICNAVVRWQNELY